MAEEEKQPERVVKNLVYPLHNEDEYKSRIKFSLIKDGETVASRQIFDSVNKASRDLVNTTTNQSRGSAEEQAAQKEEFEGTPRESTAKETKKVIEKTVSLYLPVALIFRDNVQYENMDLGATGALAATGLGVVASGKETTKSFINSLISSFGGDNSKLASLAASEAVGKTASAFGLEGAASGRKIAAGVTINPNTRALFKGVNIRDFAFTFKMIARSQEEAAQIKRIIHFFRTEVYPESIPVTLGEGNAAASVSVGYVFPKKFDIRIEYNGVQNTPEIKECYLRDVNTVYNPSGMGMHSDGQFLEIDMTLNFQETRALTKEDIVNDPFYTRDGIV